MEQRVENPKLLIVDDQAFVRASLKLLLETTTDLRVVGEAGEGEAAVSSCAEVRPDLVLMDVQMPGMDGIEAMRRIKAECPETSILVLTAHASQDLLLSALRAGAAGFILKGSDHNSLIEAIRLTLNKGMPIDPELASQLLRRLALESVNGEAEPPSPSRAARDHSLSTREIDALRLIAAGKTNRQIAQELMISLSSVKTYVQRIIRKLGVSDRTQASVRAIELGLLPDRERP